MFRRAIKFLFERRPDINEQNTGHFAFQRSAGLAYADYKGNGAQAVVGTMLVGQPSGIAVGPTHKLNDPTATGNNSYGLEVRPLTTDDPFGASIQQL